ncbi:hypothetical protein B0H14DRAFT_2610922 [Mycena olivaceomarginata]|nr:hypothetical protein B0H14DRAFT_2610922 [Mycena olivaceomarginata]
MEKGRRQRGGRVRRGGGSKWQEAGKREANGGGREAGAVGGSGRGSGRQKADGEKGVAGGKSDGNERINKGPGLRPFPRQIRQFWETVASLLRFGRPVQAPGATAFLGEGGGGTATAPGSGGEQRAGRGAHKNISGEGVSH